MTDISIKNGIENFLDNNSLFNFSNVNVFVQQGVVLLVGMVTSTREKDYVATALKRLPGVKKVICKLELTTEMATAKLPPLLSIIGA